MSLARQYMWGCLGSWLLLAGATTSFADTRPIIQWVELDWRPAWILDGPLKGKGYSDIVQRLAQENLPQYDHQIVVGNWARLDQMIAKPTACFAAAFYQWPDGLGGIRKDIVISAPIMLFFYHGIIVDHDTRPKLAPEDQRTVSLAQILNRKDLRFGAQPGRPFSTQIDPLFAALGRRENLVARVSANQLSEGMFAILEAGRIDYFVDYYPALKYRQLVGQSPTLTYLNIKEHEDIVGLGAFSCGAGPEGEQRVHDLNQVLSKIRHLEEFRNASRDWFMLPGQKNEDFWHLWNTELMTVDK